MKRCPFLLLNLLLILTLSQCVALKKHMREREQFLAKERGLKKTAKTIIPRGAPGMPTRIVATADGVKRMKPSVWMAQSKRFSNPQTHKVTVQKGDTVYAIARKHGVPFRDIIQNNRLHRPLHCGWAVNWSCRIHRCIKLAKEKRSTASPHAFRGRERPRSPQ